ncbi:GHKL domain-containing protein [Rhizosphaericola mali]|uniref:GHKL domain-containing protein n=2 Tax=Rhizosphaericola mali TaxID=2545455 RepID=A0A5P2FYL8_9BACT|nr:GHKL domain-containing protein [Rhizosphaericola mali]
MVKFMALTKVQTDESNFLQSIMLGKTWRVARHIFCLIVIILFNYIGKQIFVEPFDTYHQIWMDLFMFAMFYVNMYFFIPQYLFKKKYSQFIFLILLSTFITYLAMILYDQTFKKYMVNAEDSYNLLHKGLFMFPFFNLVLIAATTAIKLFQRWLTDAERINELEKENLHTELEQLKNQITPHFLFNTLNNANVLTQKDPDKASEVLVRLSNILRYQLYDSARSQVLLSSEIRFLNDMLNLEKIRRSNFTFTIGNEGDMEDFLVAPMLFTNFVENAVKYSADIEAETFIDINFRKEGKVLYFSCINSLPLNFKKENNSVNHGIGLNNVKRRLELIYPNRYLLKNELQDKTYEINLKLLL